MTTLQRVGVTSTPDCPRCGSTLRREYLTEPLTCFCGYVDHGSETVRIRPRDDQGRIRTTIGRPRTRPREGFGSPQSWETWIRWGKPYASPDGCHWTFDPTPCTNLKYFGVFCRKHTDVVHAAGYSQRDTSWQAMALPRNTTALSIRYRVGRSVVDGVEYAEALSVDQDMLAGGPIHRRNQHVKALIQHRFVDQFGFALRIGDDVL